MGQKSTGHVCLRLVLINETAADAFAEAMEIAIDLQDRYPSTPEFTELVTNLKLAQDGLDVIDGRKPPPQTPSK